jgi:hypothetical protein
MMGVRGYYKDVIIHDLKVAPAPNGIHSLMQEMLENIAHDDLKIHLDDMD